MLSIAVAALANVIGLAAAVLALILFSRADGNWRTSLRSRRGLGLLSLFVAGCLLGVGGQFMLSRLLSYGPASRAEAQARLQMALQEPLEALTVQVHGSDPFRDRPDACSLRLLAVTRVGQRVISELPRSRLLLPESDGAKVPATTTKDFREYIISWQSVIEGATSEEGRAVAARIGHLNDWRRFDRVEAEIVARTTESVPMPDSLRIASRADQPVELLNGRKTSEKAEQHGDVWVCAYHDHPPWLSQADRLTGWMAEEAYRTPHRGLDFILMGLLAVGSCLLVVGIRLIDGMTMINRYCGGLASTLWSSSRDGRWILPLILVAYFLILAALSSSRNLVSAWEALGVSALAPSFADTRFITATMDSQRLGHDPYIENPCDPWRRPMNYPRIWLALASFGLTQDHTVIVGVGLAVIFFGCLLCWAARMNPAQSLIFGIFLCSPHVMWVVERGNVDLVIFILLTSSLALVRWYPKMRPVLYASIMLSSILKLYPIAGMLVVGRDKPRRALAWGLIILIIFSAYIFFTWPDLILVIQATPRSSWWSYGRMIIFDLIGSEFRARAGVEIPHSCLVFSSLVAVGTALSIAFLWASKIHAIPKDTDHLDSFVIGSGIYVGTFLIGTSFDYKLIFLILLLPQLFDWIQDRGELVCPAYSLLTALMLSIWVEFLLVRIRHRPVWEPPASGILLQELANWLLLVLILVMNILIIRGWFEVGRHSKSAAGGGIVETCGASTELLAQ